MGLPGKEPDMDWQKVWDEAVAAADKAVRDARPARFVVQQRVNPLDDNSPPVQEWTNGGQGYEAEGMAFVKVNGNSGFGRWLKKNGNQLSLVQRDWYGGTAVPRAVRVSTGGYYGGVQVSAPERGYERSVAWARGWVSVVADLAPQAKATFVSFVD